MGLDYPQALDRQRTASKHNADPSKGTTLVIDGSNHIVATTSDPAEIRAAVAKLLSRQSKLIRAGWGRQLRRRVGVPAGESRLERAAAARITIGR